MHHHDHVSQTGEKTSGKLAVVFFLNLGFLCVEFVGGMLTNSVAILSDAVHDLGDTVSIGFAWIMEKYAVRGPTSRLTFGYRRFSLAGAIVSSTMLLVGSGFILYRAVSRLIHPESVHPRGMLWLAIMGILINGIAVLRLRAGKKINERVIFVHLMEDVLGWAAVLVVSIVLLFYDLPILDPLLSIGITIFILSKIIPNIRGTLKIFMQYSPADADVEEIADMIRQYEFVADVHDMHIWSLDGQVTVLSCHVRSRYELSLSEAFRKKQMIKKQLRQRGIDHITMEIEPDSSICDECFL